MSRAACVLLVAVCLATGASAASLSSYGQPGAPGAAPQAGPPPVPGGAGGDGEAAVVSLVASDMLNDARAVGGDGGAGGGVSPGDPGGPVPLDAGAGGNGGAAEAHATLTAPAGPTRAGLEVTSIGGRGGNAGSPSPGELPVTPPGQGASGGNGGDAFASAGAEAAADSDSEVAVLLHVSGGGGGAGSVTGGTGGDAGAAATLHGSNAHSVWLDAFLRGGDGGSGVTPGAAGSVLLGPLSVVSDGGGDVYVNLDVTGGNGGAALSGGLNGDGADVALHNAVSASSSFVVHIDQAAHGGHAGNATLVGPALAAPGDGGDASSELIESFDAEYVSVGLFAEGGIASTGAATAASGGDARVVGDLTNDGDMNVLSHAIGGMAGGTGPGGDASISLRGVVSGDDHGVGMTGDAIGGAVDRTPSLQSLDNAGRGGDAVSHVVSEALGEGEAFAQATAQGGSADRFEFGVNEGGDGGNADAVATATTYGFAPATARAYAYGGDAGGASGDLAAGTPGSTHARAHASSDFGDVSLAVIEQGGSVGPGGASSPHGGDVTLENAATGETLGGLTIEQAAWGGRGVTSRGGDARSVLDVERAAGGDLWLAGSAEGGSGSESGNATSFVTGVTHNDANVFVSSVAVAGTRAAGDLAGGAQMRAHGESLSGDVEVVGVAMGGAGRLGADVYLNNAVTGETSGALTLTQRASGGQGVDAGGAGDSVLTREGSFAFLTLVSEAFGGGIDYLDSPEPASDLGYGNASAVADGRNQTGGVEVTASARGGHHALAGANAVSVAYGESYGSGEGAAVFVHGDSQGGTGQLLARLGPDGTRGGDAQSTSIGVAFGDTSVVVDAYSQGGIGGSASFPDGANGAGGDSRAEAIARGGGTSLVSALATAYGGYTGFGNFGEPLPLGPHGGAVANAFATGFGALSATANAAGEESSHAASEVTRLDGPVRFMRIERTAVTEPSRNFLAASAAASFELAPTRQNYLAGLRDFWASNSTSAFAEVDAAIADTWLAGNPNTAAALASHGELLALGAVSLTSAADDLSTSLYFDISGIELAADESLFFGWLDTESHGASFDVLHLALFADGGIVFEASFSDASLADAQLDDLVLPLSLDVTPISLQLVLDAHYAGGTGDLNTDFAVFTSRSVTAPEPAVFALLLAALTALALARRS